MYGIHFERTRVYVGEYLTSYVKVLELTERNYDKSYPLHALYLSAEKCKYGTAAENERFKNGVYISDIINLIGKKYDEIPFPDSYDIEIKKRRDNSVSIVTNRETGECSTVCDIFKGIIRHFNSILKEKSNSDEIKYILTIPPYLTELQTKIICNSLSECGLKLIDIIYEPVASVFACIKDKYVCKERTYIVVNLDKNSFTGSVVTVNYRNIKLKYFIRDDSLGYSHIENSFISTVYDKLDGYNKKPKYTDLQEKFVYISCGNDFAHEMSDLYLKERIEYNFVLNLWKSLASNIHKRIDELYAFIDDNGLENVEILTSGSGFAFKLFNDYFYHICYKDVFLKGDINLSEISVTGATLFANDREGYVIDSPSFTEDQSYGIDIGNKYCICSCFKRDSIISTKQFGSFIDMTYKPASGYLNSEEDMIKINRELLRKIKNTACFYTKYITSNIPTVFTIPLSFTANQKYDLKREAEKCGFNVLSLLYSSFAVVISYIYMKKVAKEKCKFLVFNFGENGNEMCIINRNGRRIELNTKIMMNIEKYSYEDITKLFIDYLSNNKDIFNEKSKEKFDNIIDKINKLIKIIHDSGNDYILVVGDLKGFSMLKDNITSLFSEEQIIYLPSDCVSVGASIYSYQILTKSDYFDIVDYSEYNDLSYGIDLGTTFSCACFMKDNNEEMIDNPSKATSTSFASTIFFEKKSEKVKYFQEKEDYNNKYYPVYDSKRFIGKNYYEINKNRTSDYLFELIEKNGKVYYNIEYNKSQLLLSPEDVSSSILNKIKQQSIIRIKTELQPNTIIPCVITTPAQFTYKQRFETKRAAQKAGLKVLSIINEPTAAAVAYINDKSVKDEECKILVYDFGGGTFDVSIVEKNGQNLRVICSDGDDHLGGEDITNRLVRYISNDVKEKYELKEINNKVKSRIIKACEKTKIQLSSTEEYILSFDFNDNTYENTITRAKLNELCKDIFDKTIEVTKRCIKKNNINEEEIKYILLSGSSSRIPYVGKKIKSEFREIKVMENINRKEAVSRGAAVYANILRGKQNEFVRITDILNHSLYYTDCENKKEKKLFEKNIPLYECHTSIQVKTDDNGMAKIKIYEKKSNIKEKINEFVIWTDFNRNVKVNFDVNDDGVLIVSYILDGDKKIMEYNINN